jgi:hypothetical protein
MATITSSTSGNFSAGSTWVGGVVPVDADSFIIANSHIVTYDVTTPVTNGFNDSDIYGTLKHQASANTILRMNGRLRVRTNGCYYMCDGAKLQFRGTAASSHIVYVYGEANASFIADGSDGMPSTTLSAAANEGNTSFSLTSAANFAIGEWVAIFNNTTSQTGNAGAATLRDEGFWIHDISGNTIYVRQFTGPDATISSAGGSQLIVSNAKVFRVGQKIIFGTGDNRNIHTITAIDYPTHTLTLSGSVTGTVTGLIVYDTGSDKIHASGDKVRKVATVTTVSSLSSANTITVAHSNMFQANDEIWIQAKSGASGTTDYAYNNYGNETPGPRYRHVISSVSSNTITLSATIGYNVAAGSLVTRLTRRIVIEPVTPNSDYYGFYVEPRSDYTQRLILKDIQMRYIGSSQGSVEGGVYINSGNYKTSSPQVALVNIVPAYNQQAWYEGVVLTGSNSTRDWGGFWVRGRYNQIRCSTVLGRFNSSYGLYYREGQCLYNSIAVGSDTWGPRIEAATEWGEIAYNYVSRCARGGRFYVYDSQIGIHHYITDATEYCAHFVQSSSRDFYKVSFNGNRRGPQWDGVSQPVMIYSELNYLPGYAYETSSQLRGAYHSGHIDRGQNQSWFASIEHNYEYDAIYQSAYLSQRIWDSNEGAWRVYNVADGEDYGNGWFETVYVPANVTLRAKAAVKLAVGFSGNYPYFEARATVSGVGPNQLGNAGGHYSSVLAGGATASQFTAAAASAYEEKEITINPVSFPRNISVGVHFNNRNASEGWWMKDIVVLLDQPYAVSKFNIINSGISDKPLVSIGSNLTQRKFRIGGRLK